MFFYFSITYLKHSLTMLSFTNFFQNLHYSYIQEHQHHPLPFVYFHVSSRSINRVKPNSCHDLIPNPRISIRADGSKTG